jgi:hypothetical protein
MNKQDKNDLSKHKLTTNEAGDPFSYPPEEDIYNKFKEETAIDPENTAQVKSPNEETGLNEKDFEEDMTGGDLDVPDAGTKENGKEDEENDVFSLGGDRHDDLEEDKGE